MATQPTILLAPVQLEANALRRLLGSRPDVILHTIGIRAVHLPANLGNLRPRRIILAGLAGALDPSLAIADVVIQAPPNLLPPNLPARYGNIHTVPHVISTPQEKQDLFRQTHALAVDMEQSIVQAAIDIPLIAVRGISDTASDALDPQLIHLIDDLGRPRPATLAATLLKHPTLLPQLLRLGKNSHRAAAAMAQVVLQILTDH